MNWLTRTLLAAGVAAGGYTAVSTLMANGLVRARRTRPEDTPASVGLPYESVRFDSRGRDIQLSAWVVPPPADGAEPSGANWVITVHGFGKHRADPTVGLLALARDLNARGYGLLMPDLRACGESGGENQSAGYFERLDLLGALDFLAARDVPRQNIGVLGFSLGGAVALMTCANPGTAAAVVADSAFADLMLVIRRSQTGAMAPLAMFNPGMKAMARLIYGVEINDVSPARSLSATDTPVMIIHGENDTEVPPRHAQLLARAAGIGGTTAVGAADSLWVVPGAGHVQAYRSMPSEYVDRVDRFFTRHLAGG